MITENPGFPTKYWHKLADERIQCDLCPHFCKLKEEQRGLCFIRACQNQQIVLTTYGLISSLAIDPIEKKPLNHFLPGSKAFSFGTIGCNLSCRFCQNWDISKCREMHRLVQRASPQAIAQAAKERDCQSVAFTYNEPSIFMEFARDTAIECHKLGIKTVSVTNGYINPEPAREFYQYIDAANVDLKGFTDEFYHRIIGGKLQPVLDTLIYLHHHTKVWLEVTTLLIPGENDSAEELDAQTKWLMANLGPDVPLHFSAFHPAWKMLDKSSTPLETLQKAREIASANGLHYVYTGNVIDIDGSSTYCHHCKNKIIERRGFTVTSYQLTEQGKCKFCDTQCVGVFG